MFFDHYINAVNPLIVFNFLEFYKFLKIQICMPYRDIYGCAVDGVNVLVHIALEFRENCDLYSDALFFVCDMAV